MKIYTQYHGWRGTTIAIANTLDEAKEIMKASPNYEPAEEIQEDECKVGWLGGFDAS